MLLTIGRPGRNDVNKVKLHDTGCMHLSYGDRFTVVGMSYEYSRMAAILSASCRNFHLTTSSVRMDRTSRSSRYRRVQGQCSDVN